MGVDGIGVVAPAPDWEVLPLDALSIKRHANSSVCHVWGEASAAYRTHGRPWRRSSQRNCLIELQLEVTNLVAQLGGVLEAQLLGGREHLLLELDDRLPDLGWRHVGHARPP